MALAAMRRRTYLYGLAGAASVTLAGCTEEPSSNSDGQGDNPQNTPTQSPTETEADVDSGVIIDKEIENPREKQLTLSKGQTIVVSTTGVDEGEEMFFTVGDGTGFVVREHFYENTTREFAVESDGFHNLRFSPKRHEIPMDKDVKVGVKCEIKGS